MDKWEQELEFIVELESENLGELEFVVAYDMFKNGYDYKTKADVIEYWNEKLK